MATPSSRGDRWPLTEFISQVRKSRNKRLPSAGGHVVKTPPNAGNRLFAILLQKPQGMFDHRIAISEPAAGDFLLNELFKVG